MRKSREQLEAESLPQCLQCKWYREDPGESTPDSPAEYDSWCDGGMPEWILEHYECEPDAEPCPLRSALEERDEWQAKAEKYRLRVADYECDLARNEGECRCFTIPPKTCVRDGRMCESVLKAVDGE